MSSATDTSPDPRRSIIEIGVLGAAKIAPSALIEPARAHPEVSVAAVAARDHRRADAFAVEHGIEKSYDSYEALLADPDLDAIYIPLPAALHGRWMLAAIDAGKHVLCEKPFTANAVEAETVAAAARNSDVVVMEAVHYTYHPLMAKVREIVEGGTLGALADVTAHFDWPVLDSDDIRYNATLGGGALMDLGCYPVHLLRTVIGCEPVVVSAKARTSNGVDVSMRARLTFPNGVTGSISSSMRSPRILPSARIRGTEGTLRVHNFVAPQGRHWISVRTSGRARRSTVERTSPYAHQLDAFVDAVLRGSPFPTTADDAVATMRVIDEIYRRAGLEPRRPLA